MYLKFSVTFDGVKELFRFIHRWNFFLVNIKFSKRLKKHSGIIVVIDIFFQEKELKASKIPQPGTREYISNDLQKLLGMSEEEKKSDEDMPPLLQVNIL